MFDSDDKKKNVSLEISSKQFFMTSPGSLLGIEGFEQINTSFFATLQIITSYSLLTEPSAPTARPPADGSLRSPTPPAARFARPHHSLSAKKFGA